MHPRVLPPPPAEGTAGGKATALGAQGRKVSLHTSDLSRVTPAVLTQVSQTLGKLTDLFEVLRKG